MRYVSTSQTEHSVTVLRGLKKKKLTAPTNALPLTMSTICSAMSWPQRAWASFVLAPRCGQLITLGWFTRAQSLGGS